MQARLGLDSRIVLAVTLLAALLRFPGIGAQNLWCDEIYSLELAREPATFIVTLQDGHPPLYHLAEKVACAIADVDTCGRLLSAVLGVATIPLLWLLARRIFDTRVAALAALLLAISPIHVWYSREGRMYALVVLWSTVSALYLPDLLERRWRGGIGYVAASLGGLFTHYAYAAVAASQVAFTIVYGIDRRSRTRMLVLAATLVVVAALAVALVPALREVLMGPVGPSRATEVFAAPYAIFTLLAGFGVGPSVRMLQENPTLSALGPYSLEISLTAALGAFVIVRGVYFSIDERPWGRMVLLVFLAPILVVAAASFYSGVAFNPRYVIGTLPPLTVLIALGLARGGTTTGAIALTGLIAVSAVSITRDRVDPDYSREQIREAATYLAAEAGPDERILYGPLYVRETLAHYLPAGREITNWPAWTIRRSVQLDDAIASLGPLDSRIWILRTREWSDDPRGLLAKELARRFPSAEVREFPGVRVYRLDP
jgi:mannosyltransferase